MSGYQLAVSLFGLISLLTSGWAVWCVVRSKIGYKVAWIAGSLLGLVGFGVNWTKPDDLILLFGIQVPPFTVFKVVATQMVIVKVMFPVVALVALGASEFGEAGRNTNS